MIHFAPFDPLLYINCFGSLHFLPNAFFVFPSQLEIDIVYDLLIRWNTECDPRLFEWRHSTISKLQCIPQV